MRANRITLGLVTAVVAVACNGASNDSVRLSPAPIESPGRPDPGPPTDWDNPIDGQRVGSSTEARAFLAFDSYEPKGLGVAKAVFLTPIGAAEKAADRMNRVIAYVYDDSSFGRVVVIEEILRTSPREYQDAVDALVANDGSPSQSGRAEKVSIRGGNTALLTTNAEGTRSSIRWIEGNRIIIVRGPQLTRQQCLTIAENL
jgi:hypothetical protein